MRDVKVVVEAEARVRKVGGKGLGGSGCGQFHTWSMEMEEHKVPTDWSRMGYYVRYGERLSGGVQQLLYHDW